MVVPNIVNNILSYIGQDNYATWYVGIATDPADRLFNQHNVDRVNGRWIYSRIDISEQDARDTEKYLLDKYPFKGGPKGGMLPRSVYAYKITPVTME